MKASTDAYIDLMREQFHLNGNGASFALTDTVQDINTDKVVAGNLQYHVQSICK